MAEHDEMVKVLGERYREVPRAIGLASQSSIIEVFTSKAGTWTILLTKADGASCIVSAAPSANSRRPDRRARTPPVCRAGCRTVQSTRGAAGSP